MTDVGRHVQNPRAFDLYTRFKSYVTVEDGVCAFFPRNFLAGRGWRAAVVSEELSQDEAKALASACARQGYRTARALDVDHFDPGLVYDLDLDAASLSSLENTFVTPSYLVVEEREQFMLVSDSDYYWSVAGPQAFLETIFGRSLDAVNQDFVRATQNYRDRPSRRGRTLTAVMANAIAAAAHTI